MFEFEWASSFGVVSGCHSDTQRRRSSTHRTHAALTIRLLCCSLLLLQATIGWIVFSVCFILYCCSDPNAPGPLGLMTGLVYLIVELLGRALRRVFGHRLSNAFFLAFQYLFRKSNPVLQVVYLVLVNGGYILFLLYGQRYYIPLWSVHTPIIVLTMLFNFISFALCSVSDPGVITKENAAEWNTVFPHDQRMYLAKVMCPTCEVEKPARSKHCAFCDRCVMKFDHHCVWVNNCIGLNNYRYFLFFLLQHVWFTLYGSILTAWMMQQIITEKDLWNVSYRDPASGKFIPSSAKFVFQYITYYHGVIWGLFMLLSVMFVVLLGFSSYHLFLAGSNTTTNERSKLGWIAQGINVHAHHELYRLNPHYIKIQSQLREANKELVRVAFEEAKRPVPLWPDANSTPEQLAEAKAISAAASAAALAVANAKSNTASSSSANASPKGAEVTASASSSSSSPPAAAAAAASLFPPPPYSPALQQLMLSYQSLKLEVVSTYEALQTLQNQGFVTPSAAEALQQGQAVIEAPVAAASEIAAKQQKAQKAGLSLGGIEATEGCVPVSAAPAAAAASASASSSGEKPKKHRPPNPYSLGVYGNFMQLLYPPKRGETVPLRNTRSDDDAAAGNRAQAKPAVQSKKKR